MAGLDTRVSSLLVAALNRGHYKNVAKISLLVLLL